MIHSLFNVPIYKTNIGYHAVDTSRLVMNRDAWDGEMVSSFETEKNVLSGDPLLDTVNWHAMEYMRSVSGRDDIVLTMEDSWVNYGVTGDCQYEHDHIGRTLAGCYYHTVPPESGEVRFLNPMNDFRYDDVWQTNQQTGYEVPHVPSCGDLWIWPGFIRHKVMMNHDRDTRITIAFNIKVTHEVAREDIRNTD